MNVRILGNTGLSVSGLAIGSLTLGPYQLNMPEDEGADVILKAVRRGINLIDTAKAYQTYNYVAKAIELMNREEREKVHIISRSYDYSREGMKESFHEALDAMKLSSISVFMLHETVSRETIRGHDEALQFLVEAKKRGLLKAVGISTHYIDAVRAAGEHPDVDVIFAIYNKEGIGIMDGDADEMAAALLEAHKRGKGILIMKALGGGHLHEKARDALVHVRDLPFADSVVIGMQDEEEIEYNARIFEEGESDMPDALARSKSRRLFIEPWCQGCGNCVARCPFGALSIEKGQARVDASKCLLCSYCARSCPEFCIKVV